MSLLKRKIRRLFMMPFLSIVILSTAACSHEVRVRPACTWRLWAVDGRLVNASTTEILPCQGVGSADCVGLTHEDLFNLLDCGGPGPAKPKVEVDGR